MKPVHLRSFPLNYDIFPDGTVRKRVSNGYVFFERTDEESGSYVHIELNGKIIKCLIAELLINSINGPHSLGQAIRYKDGNIHNPHISNLKTKKQKHSLKDQHVLAQDKLISYWLCDSKANSANKRYAAKQQIITPSDVLRCLVVNDFRCFYCDVTLTPYRWQLDHYIPKNKSGKNEFDNLRPSCKYCNVMKSDMTYEETVRRSHAIICLFIKHNPEHHFSSKAKELLESLNYSLSTIPEE